MADGVNIVKTNKDAQLCYSALVFRFEQSPEATMDANTIREKIHDLKLDKSWRETAPKFLQHFESQIILLESLTEDAAMLWPEKTKMVMLESAVKSNKDLAMIMSQERLDVAKGCAPMMFPPYVSLLKSRAHKLDAVEGKSGSGRSRYRSIHNSEHDGQGGRGGCSGHDGL